MNAPRLNRKLVLETPETLPNGSGGFDVSWTALGTVWAQVSARTGRETVSSAAPVSSMAYRIVVRGALDGDPRRPKPNQRFRDDARIFHVQAVAETDSDGRYLTCFVTEETVT